MRTSGEFWPLAAVVGQAVAIVGIYLFMRLCRRSLRVIPDDWLFNSSSVSEDQRAIAALRHAQASSAGLDAGLWSIHGDASRLRNEA
jgi:hypothetical protein